MQVRQPASETKRHALFPAVAIRLFLLSIVAIVVALFLVDRFAVPRLERSGRLAAAQWKDEDLRLMRQNFKKILATAETPWSTRGFAVGRTPRRAHRILVVGDSFTWGDGYANLNDVWWRQLERELHRRGYNDVEVVAGAMCGMSTREELELAKHIVPQLRPDLVIFGYVTNDPEEGLVPYLEVPERDRFEAFLDRFRIAFPNLEALLTDRHRRRQLVAESGGAHGYPYPDRELLLVKGKNFEKYRSTLAEVLDYFAFIDIPVIAVVLPQFPSRAYFAPRLAPVRKAFASAHVPFFDLLDAFINRYGDVGNDVASAMQWGINPANVHPGPRAAHFYADQIASILESKYPAVIGSRWERPIAPRLRVNDWLPYDLSLAVTDGNTIAFDYPSHGDLPRMPVQHPYIQFNFEEPADVREIRLTGRDLIAAEVAITSVDPEEHFDSLRVHSLGVRRGASLSWTTSAMREAKTTSTIRISAQFRGVDRYVDRHLRLVIVPADSAVLDPFDFQLSGDDSASARTAEHEWRIGGAADFDGDGKPDVVWDDRGTDEVTIGSTLVQPHRAGWNVVGTADLNADGHPDLLVRESATGRNVVWIMSGPRVSKIEELPAMGPAWYLGGAADFDGDGATDLVWRNDDTGEDEVWLMRGNVLVKRVPLPTIPATASRIEAVADINRDGHPDLIWRNIESGDVVAWLMNGITMTSGVPIATIQAPAVDIAAAADFNGDGRPDLVWRNRATGDNVVWLMNGANRVSTVSLPALHDTGEVSGLSRNTRTGTYLLRTSQGMSMPFATLDDFRWAMRNHPGSPR